MNFTQRLAGLRARLHTWRTDRPITFYSLTAFLTLGLAGGS